MSAVTSTPRSTAECLADVFDTHLRHAAVTNDMWMAKGRSYFASKVEYFVARYVPIEFVLPAFPCKSSNRSKVVGRCPDRGEELALRRLHAFIRAIERIYKPGGRLWIVSDGHVFSDCIGVDDDEVNQYGALLKEMNAAIASESGGRERVVLRNLMDLFRLEVPDSNTPTAVELQQADPDHFIKTELSAEAELCRKILMAGRQPHRAEFRSKIQGIDPLALATYRGVSRFMLEDLGEHPETCKMSRSQRKKLATKVAFEMVMRNQAYSDTVQRLFPNHIRLSIHAHENCGPKFGIQLFDEKVVKATDSLEVAAMVTPSADRLHIPTPWHNCVVELAGWPFLFVTKNKVAQDAIGSGTMGGAWIAGSGSRGGYFLLWPLLPEEGEPQGCAGRSNRGER